MFQTIDRLIIRFTSALLVGLMVLMTSAVIIGVYYRYVLNDALPWPEELARYSQIWLTWIGGGLALRRGSHIATDLLVSMLPPVPHRIVMGVGNLLILAFLGIIAVNGVTLVESVEHQPTIALGVSMQIPYAAAPIGSALMIYHLLVVIFARQSNARADTELQV
jgi:TRAP-type C4-dicarboxylate transport system permease small subunit